MALRLGYLVVTPHDAMLALAVAFYLRYAWARLYPQVSPAPRHACVTLAVSCLAAAAGALIHGWMLPDVARTRDALAGSGWSYGSFGAAWGAIAGAALAGRLQGGAARRCAEAVTPAVVVALAVDRLAGVFAVDAPSTWFPGPLQVLQSWSLYDLAALALTYAVATRRRAGALLTTAWLYGLLRFAIEFLRDAPALSKGLTSGQWLCVIQMAAALAGWVVVRASRRVEKSRETCPPGNCCPPSSPSDACGSR